MDHQSDMTCKRSFFFWEKLLCKDIMRHNRKRVQRSNDAFKPVHQPGCVSEHLQTHWRVLMKGCGYTDIFRGCQQRWKGAQEKLEDSCLKKEKMKKGRHKIFSYIWSTSSRIFLRYYNAGFFFSEEEKIIKTSLNKGGPWACSCKKKIIFFLPCCQHEL